VLRLVTNMVATACKGKIVKYFKQTLASSCTDARGLPSRIPSAMHACITHAFSADRSPTYRAAVRALPAVGHSRHAIVRVLHDGIIVLRMERAGQPPCAGGKGAAC